MTTKIESIKRRTRRHIKEEHGMSFKAMAGMLKTDPFKLLEILDSVDEQKVDAQREKHLNRKPYTKNKGPTIQQVL